MKGCKISRIELENFQCHEHTVLDLHEGLNILSGPTEYGKTAILRALHWVFYNTWDDIFIRMGENRTVVRVYYNDGHVIEKIRNRAGSINRYILTYPDGTKLQLDKFGASVPKQVEEIHRMTPWVLDDGIVLNPKFRMQIDPIFLVFERGHVKAKAVGHMAGVHVFDAAIQSANLDLSRLNREEKALNERLSHYIAEKEKYTTLNEEEEKLTYAKSNLEQLETIILTLEQARGIIDSLRHTQSRIACGKEIVGRLMQSESYIPRVDELDTRIRNLDQARNAVRSLRELKNQIQILGNVVSKAKRAEEQLKLHEELSRQIDVVESVRATIQRLKISREEMDLHARNIERTKGVDHALSMTDHVLVEADRLEKARSIVESLNRLTNELSSERVVYEKTVQVERVYDCSVELENLLGKLEMAKEVYRRIQKTQDEIKRQREILDQAIQDENRVVSKYETILKNLGDECPVCLRPMDEDVVKHATHLLAMSNIG